MDKLRTVYGDEFLKYALAVDKLDIATGSLSAGQQESFGLLEGIAKRLFGPRLKIRAGAQIGLLHSVGQYVPQSAATLCSALRTGSGGTLADIKHSDPVIRKLLVVARDIWPVFLLPRPENWPLHRGLSTSVSAHPVAQEVQRLLLADDLARFFPDPEDPSAPVTADGAEHTAEPAGRPFTGTADVTSTVGHLAGMRLADLPDALLLAARYRQLLGRDQSLKSYLGQVEQATCDARKLAAGGQVSIPVLIGLTNLRVRTPNDVVTPFGVFRAPRESDTALLPRVDGTEGRVTAVLETAFPMRILAARAVPTDPTAGAASPTAGGDPATGGFGAGIPPAFSDHRRRAERTVHLARYALLLATERTLLAPVPVAQAVFDPTRAAPIQSYTPRSAPAADTGADTAAGTGTGTGTGTVDETTRQRIESWARKVDQQHPTNLDFGVRRLLAAATTDTDPADGLVDAVACWTAMFGAGPGAEAGFRVCGAMASILEPYDRGKRLAVFRALQRLHDTSSAIAHGGEEADSQEIDVARQAAVGYAVDAMRKLYDFPGLLTARSPGDRGRDILLYSGAISYGS